MLEPLCETSVPINYKGSFVWVLFFTYFYLEILTDGDKYFGTYRRFVGSKG